ncbi:MAG TPA: hypothetical protein VJQ60_16000 [Arthrobacter sp.]|nr:hypothetical protein [Arthrobacter sp.]
MQLNSENGGLELTAETPCNPVSLPAMITGSALVVEKLALGAAGYAGDPAEQEKWVVQFLAKPIEMTFDQNV